MRGSRSRIVRFPFSQLSRMKACSLLLTALLMLGISTTALAQVAPADPTPSAAATSSVSAEAFDVEAASEAYMAQLSPEARSSSDAYYEGGYWLLLWNLLIALGVAWLLLGTRLSARMRDFAERCTRYPWLQTVIYATQYLLLTTLLMLPWAYYEGFVREHQYGLSTQDLAGWASDQFMSLLVTLVLGSLVLAAIYAVIRVLNHVYTQIGFLAVMLVAGFAFVRWGFAGAQRRWGERWGIRGVADTAETNRHGRFDPETHPVRRQARCGSTWMTPWSESFHDQLPSQSDT